MKDMHIVLKYKRYTGRQDGLGMIDTALEHKQTFKSKHRLIWGQSSKMQREGIKKDSRDRIKEQVKKKKSSYAFFLGSIDSKSGNDTILYVGKINDVYSKNELINNEELIQFIPSYYASKVVEGSDSSNVLIDVSSFIPVNKNILDMVTIESSQTPFNEMGRNSTSVFNVNIDDELLEYLESIHSTQNEEEDFQNRVEHAVVEEEVEVNDKPQDKTEKVEISSSLVFERDPKISKKVIKAANYTCEIDETHKHFISRITNKNYVEAHHLIPIKYQNNFINSIDVESNIISICPACHKKLHHGLPEEIKLIVEMLHQKRIERMKKSGIEITTSDLLSYY